MKTLVIALLGLFVAASASAAPTPYDLGKGLVSIMDANNEMDGPFQFLVCEDESKTFGDIDDYASVRNVSNYYVLRKGGDFGDGAFQVVYSVIASWGFQAQSITRLSSAQVPSFACPEGTYQVYTETR